MNAIIETIDKAIKQTWINEIPKDYEANYLLKEDTLKNAFYHHIRSKLDDLLKENNLRIYTEFNECGLKTRKKRADLAIVKMKDEPGDSKYLSEDVESVFAIIELKFKSGGSSDIGIILDDVVKTKSYIQDKKYAEKFKDCQFYLGIIHEHKYNHSELQWLGKKQYNNWAKGRLTELNACYFEERPDDGLGFSVCSYNDYNTDLERREITNLIFAKLM